MNVDVVCARFVRALVASSAGDNQSRKVNFSRHGIVHAPVVAVLDSGPLRPEFEPHKAAGHVLGTFPRRLSTGSSRTSTPTDRRRSVQHVSRKDEGLSLQTEPVGSYSEDSGTIVGDMPVTPVLPSSCSTDTPPWSDTFSSEYSKLEQHDRGSDPRRACAGVTQRPLAAVTVANASDPPPCAVNKPDIDSISIDLISEIDIAVVARKALHVAVTSYNAGSARLFFVSARLPGDGAVGRAATHATSSLIFTLICFCQADWSQNAVVDVTAPEDLAGYLAELTCSSTGVNTPLQLQRAMQTLEHSGKSRKLKAHQEDAAQDVPIPEPKSPASLAANISGPRRQSREKGAQVAHLYGNLAKSGPLTDINGTRLFGDEGSSNWKLVRGGAPVQPTPADGLELVVHALKQGKQTFAWGKTQPTQAGPTRALTVYLPLLDASSKSVGVIACYDSTLSEGCVCVCMECCLSPCFLGDGVWGVHLQGHGEHQTLHHSRVQSVWPRLVSSSEGPHQQGRCHAEHARCERVPVSVQDAARLHGRAGWPLNSGPDVFAVCALSLSYGLGL